MSLSPSHAAQARDWEAQGDEQEDRDAEAQDAAAWVAIDLRFLAKEILHLAGRLDECRTEEEVQDVRREIQAINESEAGEFLTKSGVAYWLAEEALREVLDL